MDDDEIVDAEIVDEELSGSRRDRHADDATTRGSEVERLRPASAATGVRARRPASTPTPSGSATADVADVDDDDAAPHVDLDVAALIAERDAVQGHRACACRPTSRTTASGSPRSTADEVDRATGRLAEALLPVLDAAEAAYLQHPDEVGPLLNVMLGELQKHGLETLDLEGQPFDPEVAEAVAHEPGDGGEVVVAEVLRSGYRWKGTTLRPAMVRTTTDEPVSDTEMSRPIEGGE